MSSDHPNRLLASLEPADFDKLRGHFKVVPLAHMATLHAFDTAISDVYFPHSGLISLGRPLADGTEVETAMIGRDGGVGTATAFGATIALVTARIIAPGLASVAATEPLQELAGQSETFRNALIRNEQYILAQAQQSATCYARHDVVPRLARFLLRTTAMSNQGVLQLTQETISKMLGVQRATLSMAASALQRAGLIEYRRGQIFIIDREGLEGAGCECHQMLNRLERSLLAPQSKHGPADQT